MDKIDELIEEVGDYFLDVSDNSALIFSTANDIYASSQIMNESDELICTVGEYKEHFNQENKEAMTTSPGNIDELNDELRKKFLLETYTGLAMQALIARGESKSGVKSLSREFAQAAIDSLNGVCDENTTE